jgi:RNA polymerase sigma factor (sigma-70 family)
MSQPIDDDEALARRAAAGDRAAFGALLDRHYPGVLRLCWRLLGGAEAEDVAQEAALRAFLDLGQLREPGRFAAWLHAIAANLARMSLRRRRTHSLEALGEPPGMVAIWSAAPAPDEVAAMRELHDTIVAALADLSPLSREAVVGFYLESYSYAELAAILGVPVGTLKGRLFFGRRQLRGSLRALADEHLAPRRKETPVEQPEHVPVTIDSVRMSTLTQHHVIVLREKSGRYLPIWVGPFEASAIATALEDQPRPRPMTHDLTMRLLETAGVAMRRVLISRLAESTFFAEIELALGGQTHAVDARPSDAIALAVRAGAPILVAREVMDQAGAVEPIAEPPMPGDSPRPRLLIIGPNAETREQLMRLLILLEGEVELVGTLESPDVEQITRLSPELLLVDVAGNSDELERLAAMGMRAPMVALVPAGDQAALNRAMLAGARQHVLKPAGAEEL